MSAALFGITILLSAFLLFQAEPLIAKLILPWFGGSAAVWTTCMLFFQAALLAGYGYAHWLSGLPRRRAAWLHTVLLAASLAFLPITPSIRWRPLPGEDPLTGTLVLLVCTLGLPYLLLSSTSPLLQAWYIRSQGGAVPWKFFAVSNFGSMIGLLSYPLVVEPLIGNRQQAIWWSVLYAFFVGLCLRVAWTSSP